MICRSRVPILVLLVSAILDFGHGQTRVDLSRQTRNIDFSSASSSKPFKTGVSIPATCSQGETFFKSDALPGTNLYLCVSTNTWSPVSEGQSSPMTRTSATQLAISLGRDVRFGSFTCPAGGSSATVTVSSGTGKAYIYLSSDCVTTVAHNVLMASCAGCSLASGTSFPANSFPIGEWEVANGEFALTGIDRVTPYGTNPMVAGTNVQIATSGGVATISALTSHVNLQGNALLVELPNQSTGGTQQDRLAKLANVGGTAYAARAETSDSAGVLGIVVSGAGTSGTSQIAVAGTSRCEFEGAAVAGNYVAAGTTTSGACRDAGSSPPLNTQVIGRVLQTGGPGLVRILLSPR
jgi:hypothetical protein